MARRLAPAAIALLLLALPATAGADTRSKRDRGGPRSGGPVLDVASLTATGSAAGLVVSARMKGNIEARLGRGELARAGIALILRPKSRSGRPSILATAGLSRRPTDLFRARSSQRGIARIGKTVHFAIRGGGLASVRRIEVKTFDAVPPRGRRARASDDIRITPEQARRFLGEDGADEATVGTPSAGASCEELIETARGTQEALKDYGPYFDRLSRTPGSRQQREAATRAADAIRGLQTETLLEIARRCGTGAKLLCSGYRHVREGLSTVSTTFEFREVFGSQLFIGSFRWEYLNPSTGQYEEARLPVGGSSRIIRSGGGIVIRSQHDIDRAGRYRVTATIRLSDPDRPTQVIFREETVGEVDVAPPFFGPTGGACPPDP
jgi:hypothetical protein